MINSVLEGEKLFVGERFSDGGKVTPRNEREIL